MANGYPEHIDTEKKRLLEEILQNGQDPNRLCVENVLFVGKSGAGKSALMSTLNAAITGKYKAWLRTGRGEAQSVTLHLQWLKNCGVRLYDVKNSEHKEILTPLVLTLPNFVDMAGLGDHNTPELREIISLIVHGYIPENTSIEELLSLQDEHGTGNLSTIYDTPDESLKITKVVFVQSSQDPVPQKLVDCLMSVFSERDPVSATLKYRGDYFVVITKKDKEDPETNRSDLEQRSEILKGASEDDIVTSEPVAKTLAKKFNIEGSLKHNLKWLASYCDDNGYDDPQIAAEALQFLVHMTQPTLQQGEKTKKVVTNWKRAKLFVQKWMVKSKEYMDKNFPIWKYVLFFLIFAVVLKMMLNFLSL